MCSTSTVNIFLTCTVYIPIVFSVSLKIDGVIDLGPNWNYEYKLESVRAVPFTANVKYLKSAPGKEKVKQKNQVFLTTPSVLNTDPESRVTKYKKFKPRSLFEESHVVKDDNKINDFTYHVYKQSLKVFDEIKQKVGPNIANRVDLLARTYDEKYREFINDTLNLNIKTRLGTQRVILNTIDTSNRLLRRLLNYFIGDLTRDGLVRTNEVAINVFQNEVEKEINLEMMHVCSKFGICRTSRGFTDFLVDFLTIILKTDLKKIKTAFDAFTEVMKNTDFGTVMGPETKNLFRWSIEKSERWNGFTVKSMFYIAKNILALKNTPFKVMVGGLHINKTVAILEVVDEIDKKLPPNAENNLEWTDLKNSLTDWSEGKRNDILEVMQGLVSQFKRKVFDTLDSVAAKNINSKLAIIFS